MRALLSSLSKTPVSPLRARTCDTQRSLGTEERTETWDRANHAQQDAAGAPSRGAGRCAGTGPRHVTLGDAPASWRRRLRGSGVKAAPQPAVSAPGTDPQLRSPHLTQGSSGMDDARSGRPVKTRGTTSPPSCGFDGRDWGARRPVGHERSAPWSLSSDRVTGDEQRARLIFAGNCLRCGYRRRVARPPAVAASLRPKATNTALQATSNDTGRASLPGHRCHPGQGSPLWGQLAQGRAFPTVPASTRYGANGAHSPAVAMTTETRSSRHGTCPW